MRSDISEEEFALTEDTATIAAAATAAMPAVKPKKRFTFQGQRIKMALEPFPRGIIPSEAKDIGTNSL